MSHKQNSKFELMILRLNLRYRWIKILITFIVIGLVYFLVYFTGGIKYVYSHSMYIPILFAGVVLGRQWGVIAALVGGVLLGPFMPLDVDTGEMQAFFNWVFRTFTFILVGFLSGTASNAVRKYIVNLTNIFSRNQETNIPNFNSLTDLLNNSFDSRKHVVITILVNNYENLIGVLGPKIYANLLRQIYDNLRAGLPEKAMLVQSDSNKFWIGLLNNDLLEEVKLVMSLLKRSLIVDDIPLYVEYSIGADVVSNQRKCLKVESYQNADIMARNAYKNNMPYIIVNSDYEYKKYDLDLISSFSKALEENQTALVYQPKVDLKTNEPIGLEALIRWYHPTKGLLMPDNFLPLIEETQLIHDLTEWVLRNAITKIKEFNNNNINIHISINISPKNLYDERFYDQVMQIMDELDASPLQIEFEITETALMTNPEESEKIIKKFVAAGFTISLDDFGKGYSSLTHLGQFKVNTLKLDRYFVQNLTNDSTLSSIVKSTINLAHQIGCKVVAEGIETMEQAEILKKYGCDYGQGFLYAKPIKDIEIISKYNKR